MLEHLFNQLALLIQSVLSILKIGIRSAWFPQKHQAKGEACIVLGNGPSLKKVLAAHEEELKNWPLICVNKFPDTPHYELLKPQYFVICSAEFWSKDPKIANAAGRHNMIQAAIDKTTWPMTFFIPYESRSNPNWLKAIQANPNIEIVFFNTTPVEGLPGVRNWLLRNKWGSPRPHNVLIPSILNAINCGFKQIYLVGADHSWIPLISVNEENVAMVNQQHFYDSATSTSQRMYKKGVKPRRLHEILEKFMLSFRAYFDLKAYAESKQVKIYNCTPGSFIDAFPRKDIKNII